MKRVILTLIILSTAQPAQAQLFRRLFGGGNRQQVQQCAPVQYAQPYYAPTYYQPVNYQVVAAVPLATVPIAVDLQAYAYSVNAAAFQSFREYQNQKSEQQGATGLPVAPRSTAAVQTSSGAEILQRSCIQCHQAGRSPKSGFAMFDESGALAQNLPLHEMAKRMLSEDPETRMPPKGQVPTHDILAVMRLAIEGVPEQPTRIAKNEVPISPFD
jgi:mono/diheme cytochrome c family protein